MTFAELTQTKGWKKFMAKLYGFGAAVVIVGALFKIMHWPGAGMMLIIGLSTEAVIFIFSAMEPVHEEYDWAVVYPELAGLEPKEKTTAIGGGQPGKSVSLFDEKVFENVKDAPQLFNKLTKGIENLGNTASSLSNISDAVNATNGYTKSVKDASKSMSNFAENQNKVTQEVVKSAQDLTGAYKKTAEGVSYSVESLTDSYNKLAQDVKTAGDDVTGAYKKLADSLDVKVDFSSVTEGNESYNEKLGVLNKNLSALNAVFELQLEGGLDKMMEDLKGAVQESEKYKGEVQKLNTNLESLNRIYGGMLTAMKS